MVRIQCIRLRNCKFAFLKICFEIPSMYTSHRTLPSSPCGHPWRRRPCKLHTQILARVDVDFMRQEYPSPLLRLPIGSWTCNHNFLYLWSISAWFRIGWTWCWWSWVISPVPLLQNICRDNFALLRSMVSPTHHDLYEKFWRPDLVWRWSRRRMFDQLVPTLCEDDLYVLSQYPACPAARSTFHFLVSDSSNNHSWALFSCIEVCPALSHIMAAFSVLVFVVVVGCCSSSLLLLKDIRDCLKFNFWILNLILVSQGSLCLLQIPPANWLFEALSGISCWRCWVIGTHQHKLAIVLTTPLKVQVTLAASIKLKMIDTGDASSVKWKFPSFFVRGHFRLVHSIYKSDVLLSCSFPQSLEIEHSSDRGPTTRQQPWVNRFKYFTVCNVVARFWCVVRFSTCIASSLRWYDADKSEESRRRRSVVLGGPVLFVPFQVLGGCWFDQWLFWHFLGPLQPSVVRASAAVYCDLL